jgi:ribosomal protein S18 acetylase RimI-like enzyme
MIGKHLPAMPLFYSPASSRESMMAGELALRLRPVTPADEPFLWQMLYYAAHMDEEGASSAEAARQNPFLAQYVTGWGKEGDLGFVAQAADGQLVGAVWVRLLTEDKQSASYVDDQTPELAIAVLPQWIGQGVGTRLLQHLLEAAQGRFPALVLTVRANNPAVRLYQRRGFVVIDEITNRVGTKSYKLLYRVK